MSKRSLGWLAIVLALGVALGLSLSFLWSASNDHSSARMPPAQVDRKVLYWHDPMVPGPKFDKPGKSPFMDMELVPVYAEEGGAAAVRIAPGVAQNLGIRLGNVERRALQQHLTAAGNVAFDERRIEVVQSRVAGTITRLYVKASLERVKRGQPLAELLAPDWAAAQQEYLALLSADTPTAERFREVARERLVILGVPADAIRALESGGVTKASTTIRAPIDGVVAELMVREGSGVTAGSTLLQINGLRTVWVNAQLPESQIAALPMGASAQVRATAWPGTIFKGRVIGLLPNVDAQTRTLTARVEVENEDDALAPGMYVALELAGPARPPELVVPSEAVIMTGARSVVIVAHENGGFDVAEVRLGAEANGYTSILSGLDENEKIVTSGQFLIDSEASLKATVNRLSSPSGALSQAPAHEGSNTQVGAETQTSREATP